MGNVSFIQGHAPGIEEAGAQDHNGLAGALFELHLDGAELAVDDVHHALDLFGRNWPRARLLPQQVHHVGGELVACLEGERNTSHTHTRRRNERTYTKTLPPQVDPAVNKTLSTWLHCFRNTHSHAGGFKNLKKSGSLLNVVLGRAPFTHTHTHTHTQPTGEYKR